MTERKCNRCEGTGTLKHSRFPNVIGSCNCPDCNGTGIGKIFKIKLPKPTKLPTPAPANLEEVEALSAKLHNIYMEEADRQGNTRNARKYEDLTENVKEYDRVLARYILKTYRREGMGLECSHDTTGTYCAVCDCILPKITTKMRLPNRSVIRNILDKHVFLSDSHCDAIVNDMLEAVKELNP